MKRPPPRKSKRPFYTGARRPFLPFRDLLTGTRADHERHRIARVALLRHLAQDPTVLKEFVRWGRLARLNEIRRCRTVSKFIQHADSARAPIGLVIAAAGDFVERGLHLSASWRKWLGTELLTLFFTRIEAEIQGHPISWRFHCDLLAPEFVTFPGEALDEARARWEQAVSTVEAAARGGRMPKAQGEHIVAYVRWLCLHRLRGQSKRSIAKAENTSWQKINQGIKEAERLLSLTLPK